MITKTENCQPGEWRRGAVAFLGLVFLLVGSLVGAAGKSAAPGGRNLSDYTNSDGKSPDGKDDMTDDSPALRKALAAGPGVVHIPPGFYRWGDVTIPSMVAVVGAGVATVVRSNGAKQIFVQKGVDHWAIRDLLLDGEAKGDWRKREDLSQHGIFTEGCWGFEIVGVTARNFSGAGLQLTRTNLGAAGWSAGGNLERITATGNYVGVRFDVRGEYLNATKLSCYYNVVGVIIHAGNTKITASNFGANIDGIVIEDKENGSHGALSNCLVNHNERYALLARNVQYGMAIDDCCFFAGTLRLENSTGVNITSGIISCTVSTEGGGANRIAGNYIIRDEGSTFNLSPSLIVKDNFTKEGLWDKNR